MTGSPLPDATSLLSRLERGDVSSAELVEDALGKVAAVDDELRALVTLDAGRALETARASDRRRAEGWPARLLEGLPVTVKDSLVTAGLRTTAGAEELADHVPDVDAPAVARLRAAGAVVIGKTNLPAWASDWQTSNAVRGTTRNPWDTSRTPGGSSGGAAVAVACGMSALDVGSDLGGSVRLPASWCGIYGLKPSWGLVPLRGHLPPGPGVLTDVDVAALGPLARSADDLDLALDVLTRPGDSPVRAWQLRLPPPRATRLRDFRIGVWLDDPLCPTESTVGDALSRAADTLADGGARVIDVTDRLAPDFAETYELAQQLIQAAVGPWLPDEQYAELVATAGGDGVTEHERWARHVTARVRDVRRAQERRAQLARSWAVLFEDVDVVICPVSPTTAPLLDDGLPDQRTVGVDGPPRSAGEQFAWLQAVGVLHLPAVSAPAGRTPRGLPVGMQIVGNLDEDRTAVAVARHAAEVLGGYTPPPLALSAVTRGTT